MGSPVLRDVNSALSRPTYTARCSEVRNVFTRLSVKDLHQVFPRLLANVFGFDGSMGWGLKVLHRTQHPLDFEAVLQFLSPSGTIFQLIETLQRDPDVRFEFPMSYLPITTLQQLKSGTVPVMYQQKLHRPQNHLGRVVETGQPSLRLNAFEYYMFHFAYWLPVWAAPRSEPPWTDLNESVYLAVFDSYCRVFLPCEGNVNVGSSSILSRLSPPPMRTTQSSQQNSTRHYWSPDAAVLSWNGLTPPCDYKPVPGLLKISAVSSSLSGLMSSHGSYMNETWCSESYAQILVEFWLNQVPSEQSSGISSMSVGQTAMPSHEHVKLVRVLIKHIHYFAAGANRHPTQSLATLQLRRTIIPYVFQKKTFSFLRHAFIHWPLDATFRMILETWLSYIQPWRYVDPSVPVDNQRSPSPGLSQPDYTSWKLFIHENITFYTVLMTDFLQRALKLNLMDLKDCILIQRVAKVFSNHEMVALVAECDTSMRPVTCPVTVPGFSIVRDSATQTQYNYKLVQYLMGYISVALHCLKHNTHEPAAITSTLPGMLSKTSGSGLVARLKSFLSVFVSDPLPQQQAISTGDRARIIQQLELAFDFFKRGFEVAAVLVPHTGTISGQLVSSIPLSMLDEQIGQTLESNSVTLRSFTDRGCPSRVGSLEPDYLQGSDKQVLSSLGRQQIACGIRKCDPSTVKPRTDPLLMPICPHENATLVRLLHRASQKLCTKIGPTLLEWRSGGGPLSWLATAILTEPVTGWKEIERQYASTPTRESGDSPRPINMESIQRVRPGYEPRISFRFLASYPNIFWFCALTFMFLLLGVSWGVLLGLLLALFGIFVVFRNVQ